MNTIRTYSIFLLLLGGITIAGCKKLIEIDPPVNSIGTEQVFQTNETAASALAGIYIQMITNTGNMVFSNGGLTIYAGLSADELTGLTGTNAAEPYQFETNTLDFTNERPRSLIWAPAYNFIYGANAVIEGIAASTSPYLDDSTRKVLTGEALFIRAFCYFYLTNFFGDVPLVLTTDYKKNSVMQKTLQVEIYNQMVKDLEEAAEKMLDDYSTGGGERVRPNKWAATALLARVHLYRQQWQEAEAQATAVIGASHYSLPADLRSVFLKNSREAIWQLKQDPTRQPYAALWDGYNCIPSVRVSAMPPATQAVYRQPEIFEGAAPLILPLYYCTPQLAEAFEAGDMRRKNWADSTPTPFSAPYNGIPFYYPNKYTQRLTPVNAAATQYYMVLRLGEQYLVRAEARAQQDDLDGAAADLNALRRRAGLPDLEVSTKEAMLAAVAHERQTELFAEWGHRWLDLKRTGQANAVLGAIPSKRPWRPFQLLYPIPPTEISANPNLKQNPEY